MNRFNLRAYRRKNDLSQSDIADYLGVNQTFVSKIERGQAKLPDAAFEKLMQHPVWKMYEESEVPQGPGDGREIEMLRAQVEELKKEKAAYWEMIVKLTERQK